MNGATMLWRAAFDADAGDVARCRAEPWPLPFADLAAALAPLLRRALAAAAAWLAAHAAAQAAAACCAESAR